jgi:quercetin dioxygenase-like cupin family protein
MKIYDWSKIPSETARPGVVRRAFASESTMLVLNHLYPGMEIFPHSHPFDQISYILEGEVAYVIEGERHLLGPGSICRVAPGLEHYMEVIGDEVVSCLDVFTPPRDDYNHLTEYLKSHDAGE